MVSKGIGFVTVLNEIILYRKSYKNNPPIQEIRKYAIPYCIDYLHRKK
jgi:hypothetical protein